MAQTEAQEVLSWITDEGHMDALRKQVLELLRGNERLKQEVSDLVARSQTLAKQEAADLHGGGNQQKRRVLDDLRRELEGELVERVSRVAMDLISDPQGVGALVETKVHEALCAVYTAKHEAVGTAPGPARQPAPPPAPVLVPPPAPPAPPPNPPPVVPPPPAGAPMQPPVQHSAMQGVMTVDMMGAQHSYAGAYGQAPAVQPGWGYDPNTLAAQQHAGAAHPPGMWAGPGGMGQPHPPGGMHPSYHSGGR